MGKTKINNKGVTMGKMKVKEKGVVVGKKTENRYRYGFFAIDGVQHYGIVEVIKPSKEREMLDYLDDITTLSKKK
tara:strand:+ start:341 stop:565 length:225 start_codon:yes stop_codon:yes gene_type:complete